MHTKSIVPILGACVLAWASAANAQVVELIVPQVGITFVSYSGDDLDSDTGIGFEAGGKIRAGGRLYVEAGVFWSTAGADVTRVGIGGPATDELRIQQVSIPVSLGFKVIKTRPLAFRIFAGVAPGFPTSVTENDLDLVKDDLNSTLWAGRAGLGLDLVLISIDAGYDFGLGNIFETSPPAPDTKLNQWFLDVGLRFGF